MSRSCHPPSGVRGKSLERRGSDGPGAEWCWSKVTSENAAALMGNRVVKYRQGWRLENRQLWLSHSLRRSSVKLHPDDSCQSTVAHRADELRGRFKEKGCCARRNVCDFWKRVAGAWRRKMLFVLRHCGVKRMDWRRGGDKPVFTGFWCCVAGKVGVAAGEVKGICVVGEPRRQRKAR